MTKNATMWTAVIIVCLGVAVYAFYTRIDSAMMKKDTDAMMQDSKAPADAMMKDATSTAMMTDATGTMMKDDSKSGGAMMEAGASVDTMMKK